MGRNISITRFPDGMPFLCFIVFLCESREECFLALQSAGLRGRISHSQGHFFFSTPDPCRSHCAFFIDQIFWEFALPRPRLVLTFPFLLAFPSVAHTRVCTSFPFDLHMGLLD